MKVLRQWFARNQTKLDLHLESGKHDRPKLTLIYLLWSLVSIDPSLAQIPTLPHSNPNNNNNSQNFPPSNSTPNQITTDYTLGAGDRLRVDIHQAKDYSGEYAVLVDGTLNLPLIGSIPVRDQTIAAVTETIAQKYAKFYKRPLITLTLIAPRPLKIAIAGEVINPGTYDIIFDNNSNKKFPSVTEIIRSAGGTTASADIGKVQIKRSFQGTSQILTVNLWELVEQGNITQDVVLRDGDAIFVPTSETVDLRQTRQLADVTFGIQSNRAVNVAIVGEVYRPGSYMVRSDIDNKDPDNTIITNPNSSNIKLQPPKLSQALSLAGGIKPLADVRKIEVRRLTRNGTERKIEINLWELLTSGDLNEDIILQDGDTIVIPQALALNPEESEKLATANFSPATIKVNVVGEVKKPGLVEIPPNTSLNQALLAAGGFNDSRADDNEVELVRLNPNGTVTKRTIEVDLAKNLGEENNPILYNNDAIVVNRSDTAEVGDALGAVFNPIAPILSIFNLLF
jgi:polysaccharide biosynthesis/export protein